MDNALTDNSPFPKRGEMVSIIQKNVKKVERTEKIDFALSCGRVCAEDVFSKNTLPNCLVSRFDGIAVRYGDFEKGPPDTSGWVCGREYEYCNTGIALPDGFDTVIAIEDVTIHDVGIEVHEQAEYRGERVFVYKCDGGFHMRSVFAHKTTRAKAQALSNGNFYRVAGTSCEVGDIVTVELLVPVEYLPDSDLLPEILGGGDS